MILLYHRVASLDLDPWRLAVSPRHFAEHLEVLRRHRRPVSLADLCARVAGRGSTRALVAVTVDDGYADNVDAALPLLERHDVPATFFVVSGGLGDGREFWWDALERLVLGAGRLPAELTLRIDDTAHRWLLAEDAEWSPARRDDHRGWRAWTGEAPTRRHALYRALHAQLAPLDPVARDDTLDHLHVWAGVDTRARPTHRRLDPGEVQRLATPHLADIGAHSVTHARLSSLSADVQATEIDGGRHQLEELTGRPVLDFAYPFGKAGDFTAETVRLVREAGFRSACGNTIGPVTREIPPFALPRIHMDDCDGDELARRLAAAATC